MRAPTLQARDRQPICKCNTLPPPPSHRCLSCILPLPVHAEHQQPWAPATPSYAPAPIALRMICARASASGPARELPARARRNPAGVSMPRPGKSADWRAQRPCPADSPRAAVPCVPAAHPPPARGALARARPAGACTGRSVQRALMGVTKRGGSPRLSGDWVRLGRRSRRGVPGCATASMPRRPHTSPFPLLRSSHPSATHGHVFNFPLARTRLKGKGFCGQKEMVLEFVRLMLEISAAALTF